jgi:hypothetical protein
VETPLETLDTHGDAAAPGAASGDVKWMSRWVRTSGRSVRSRGTIDE